MNWTTRARIQRILSVVPGGKLLYFHVGQRLLGGLRNFRVNEKVGDASALLSCLHEAGGTVEGCAAVEIGTGWVPVIPLFYWLCGLEQCYSYDISRLLKPGLVVMAARQLVELPPPPHFEPDAKERYSARRKSLQELMTTRADGNAILMHCGVDYRAPADASAAGLPDGSVDLTFSNVVLEHVPLDQIHAILAESHRILRPGGFTFHLINPADHFSYSDRSISPINFLKFSAEQYAKYNSYFIFQNRLRSNHYRQLFQEHGFDIVYWRVNADLGALARTPRSCLHPDFAALTDEEICTYGIYVVGRRV